MTTANFSGLALAKTCACSNGSWTACHGRADAREAALGWVPGPRDFDLGGMDHFDAAKLAKAQEINVEEWRRESLAQDELAFKLHSDFPRNWPTSGNCSWRGCDSN